MLIHKPVLRRCISSPRIVTADSFPSTNRGFYTFPYTTYWTSKAWDKTKIDILNGFETAKMEMDFEIKQRNIYMREFCEKENDKWKEIKPNNKWKISYDCTKRIKIEVRDGLRTAIISICPFLDQDKLAIEFNRLSGCSLLMHQWLRYVIKFMGQDLHRR